jgi:hypothetical protein
MRHFVDGWKIAVVANSGTLASLTSSDHPSTSNTTTSTTGNDGAAMVAVPPIATSCLVPQERSKLLVVENPELRLTGFLVCLGAALVRGTSTLRVVFLSPTLYYLQQAQGSGGAYLHENHKAGSSPRLMFRLAANFTEWNSADVVLMHGQKFYEPPPCWSGVCIVQQFEGGTPWTMPLHSRCCCSDC